MEEVLARLDQLERRNRLWPYLTGVLVLLAFLVGLLAVRPGAVVPVPVPAMASGGGSSKVLEAETFRLKDRNGKVRATLGFEQDGGSALIMYDPDGTQRMWLSASEDGTSVFALGDIEGRRRLELLVRDSGAPSMKLYDPRLVPLIHMSLMKSGGPGILILDPVTGRPWLAPTR